MRLPPTHYAHVLLEGLHSRLIVGCRSFEDYVTWVDSSKIKEKVMKYNDALDDYDLLGN